MKYALVTGSTRGIGAAIATELENQGYTVIRNGRMEHPEIKNYIKADVSTKEGVEKLVTEIMKLTEKVECLVLNAGATCRKKFEDITYEEWQEVMDVNLNMPFLIAQKLYRQMAEDGSIVFISSALSLHPHATSIPYGVSKAGINMLAKCLAREYADKRVRVNAVCPGFVDTEWQKEKPEWLREKIASKTVLNRFATPQEIAQMCVAVCENTFMNGAVVSVDGGYNIVN